MGSNNGTAVSPITRTFIYRYRRVLAAGVYVGASWLSNVFAFLLRFDATVPAPMWAAQWAMLPWLIGFRIAAFLAFGQFPGLWRYASIYDLWNIGAAVFASSAVFIVAQRWIIRQPNYPRSVVLVDALVLIMVLGTLRMARRVYHEMRRQPAAKRILVLGAGDAGEMIVRDMLHTPGHDYHPIGFLDDDPGKQGEQIHGVRVLGTIAQLEALVERAKPDSVLIAMPSAPRAAVRNIVQRLQKHPLNIVTVPKLSEIVGGSVAVEQIRKLSVEDLLARPPVGLDPEPVRRLLSGRRVMVTGAGGSIGSELCRQVAGFGPQAVLLLDRYENSLFAISNELRDRWPALDVRPLIGDICDEQRLHAVFGECRPEILFHAAAHKHVPLMELSPGEAVKNNVFGTENVVRVSERFGVSRFVLISTDKAVNPTSAMGVSKRIAEMIVQSRNGSSQTVFAAVRFGNVLGSNGSVVPRFLEQIKAGGPVTVTHPEMRRFFMLIPEAVQLVMQAAALATGGEVFVLEMGEQVKIVDMARTLIRLAGYLPDTDIQVQFTGLRPGEKLYEELVGTQESIEPSGVDKVNRLQRDHPVERAALDDKLVELQRCVAGGDRVSLQRALTNVVPTYAAPASGETREFESGVGR